MYLASLWNKVHGESGDSYGESLRTPHIKGTSPLKHDCEEGRGDTSDCLKLVFYHQKPAHKHVVTSVNFHVAKGKITSVVAEY